MTQILAPNMTAMLEAAMQNHLSCVTPDAVLSIETHLFDCQFRAESMEFDFDVGHQLFLNIGRFSRLVKEYVPRTPFAQFIALCETIVKGDAREGATAGFLFRDPKRSAKKHRWGGCLQSAHFKRRGDGKFTFTLNSRTTYLGYMGHLDACLAYTMVSYIVDDPSQVELIWNIGSVQLHAFKSLPLIFRTPELMSYLNTIIKKNLEDVRRQTPTWFYLAKWYERILRDFRNHGVDMVAIEKYGPFKRVKRRWLEHTGRLAVNIPPSLPVQNLTIDKAVDDADVSYEPVYDGPDTDDESDD